MKGVILHAIRHTLDSPRKGRPEYELWTQSSGLEAYDHQLHDWTRHFDAHDVEPRHAYLGIKLARGSTWRYYTKVGPERIIYLKEPHAEVPASKAYPLEEVLRAVPQAAGRLGCTTDLQIALAVAEGFTDIVCSGVGFFDPTLRGTPKDPMTPQWIAMHRTPLWWVGFCAGRGINLTFEAPSIYGPLAGVYGYDGFVKERVFEVL